MNPMEWVNQIVLVSCSFCLIFFLCELGQKVTDQFAKFNTELYQSEWYLFPIGVQQMLATFMLDTQQPVFIRGSGNILCTREVFKKVLALKNQFKKNESKRT